MYACNHVPTYVSILICKDAQNDDSVNRNTILSFKLRISLKHTSTSTKISIAKK